MRAAHTNYRIAPDQTDAFGSSQCPLIFRDQALLPNSLPIQHLLEALEVASVRLGQILTEHGVITHAQSEQILREQQRTGEPFGLICERLFNVSPRAVEEAWAAQYAGLSKMIDPTTEAVDDQAMALVTRRQAWQFRVLPLRFDGRELMLVTTPQHLRRALRFATGVLNVPVYLVLAAPQLLGEALCRYYSLPGMTPESINDEAMDRLLA